MRRRRRWGLADQLNQGKENYTHGWHRIQLALFCHLAAFSENRPSALLNLCYRHVVMTLLWEPKGGPYRILIGLMCEFINQHLDIEDRWVDPRRCYLSDPYLFRQKEKRYLGIHVLSLKSFLIYTSFSIHMSPGLTFLPMKCSWPQVSHLRRASAGLIFGLSLWAHRRSLD